ncbi:MAG: calcineurin-like phosphoesterase C-terminal domain-containing protein [Pseudomonadota bacterium]
MKQLAGSAMRFLKPSLFALGLLGLSGCTSIDYEIDFGEETKPNFVDYVGAPNIVRGAGDRADMAKGVVFLDSNQNSVQDEGENGLAGVKVSNGRDVVLTDTSGAYALPSRDDMAVFVIQPSGYQVPHNDSWVPQFAYQHKPDGSPKKLRYGGLPATGPLPQAINFPLIKSGVGDDFGCAILGDPQTYANQDISFFRDSTIDTILDRNDETKPDCVVALGDVIGDDLGLIPRMAEVMSVLEAPQWWVHGNHDFDFDADFDEDSADSWRNLYGPNYFAFEIGDVLFISLDNVVYPCTAEDAKREGREYCVTRDRKAYNGRITDDQMAFVENLLALTPEDKLVVVAHHIPFVSFVDSGSPVHQTDNVMELYALLEGREALSLSGHTHTIENFSPGDLFEGWTENVGIDALPFRHIIAGAGSGGWFQGDFDVHGVPMALQRLGGPMGWLDLQFDDADYVDTYYGANTGTDRRMWLSVNTPDFRVWFDEIMAWRNSDRNTRNPVPPLSINDLPDVKIMTPEDLAGGSFLTANVWNGNTETQVSAEVNGQVIAFERTQTARGDAPKIGAEWADPFATQRQLSVARYAYQSRSGDARNQGFEAFKGSSYGPSAPQVQSSVADRNMHLWRAKLPADLPMGVHRVEVTSIDRHGRESVDTIVIEIRPERPQMRFRKDVFFATPDGPPVR